MKINTRVIGLGCVGLPMVKHLAGKLSSYVFDINKNADIAISILVIFLNINRFFLNFNFTKINKLFIIDFSSTKIM